VRQQRSLPSAPALAYLDWVAATASTRAEKAAIIEAGTVTTYRCLMEEAGQAAHELRSRGVRPGEPIGIAMEPATGYVGVFLAIMMAGGVAAPLNTRLKPAELSAYAERLGLTRVVTDRVHESLIGSTGLAPIAVPGRQAGTSLAAQLSAVLGSESLVPTVTEGEPAVIFPTGGTTGLPKGAFTDHRGLATWAWNVALSGRRTSEEIELYFSPCFHVTFVVGILTPLFMGNTIVIQPRFDPDAAIDAIREFGVNRLMGAPTMFKALLDRADDREISLGGVSNVLFGSAAARGGLIDRMIRGFPNAALMTGLGATEFASSVSRIEPDELRAGKVDGVGRILPGARLKILDADGREVPPGVVGEVAVRSPWQTLGYWNQDEQTAATYDADGFVRLGDLGRVDGEGWLTLVGRSKDMILSGGENIFPAEVEAAVSQMAGVDEVIVFGIADEYWGERVEAAVTVKPGCVILAEDIRAYSRRALADYKVPKRVHIVKTLPLTPNNKPDRRALAQLIAAADIEDAVAD
jgi:fatty-acyl-CoA synthase